MDKLPDIILTERALIGLIMLKPDTFPEINSLIRPEYFLDVQSKAMFGAFQALTISGKSIEAMNLRKQLFLDKSLKLVGGIVGIASFGEYHLQHPDSFRADCHEKYCNVILHDYRSRTGRQLLSSALQSLEDGADIDDISSRIVRRFDKLASSTVMDAPLMRDVLTRVLSMEDTPKVATRWRQFDTLCLGGINHNAFVVIAGRTGAGKTDFLLNMLLNCSKNNKPIRAIFFSLEMDEIEINYRLMAQLTSATKQQAEGIVRGLATKDTIDYYYDIWGKALENLAGRHIRLKTGSMTLSEIHAYVSRYRNEIDCVFIDYLQLVKVNEAKSEYDRITAASILCKQMANKYKIPVIVAAQLNREGVRDGKEPSLFALKGSGQIENDADVIFLLHRDHEMSQDIKEEELRVQIAKHRGYPTAYFKWWYEMHTGRVFEQVPQPMGEHDEGSL